MGKPRKVFERGQEVEVRRTPSGPWICATYAGEVKFTSAARYHRVTGDNLKHYVDSMTGVELSSGEGNPRAYLSTMDIVPSQRIRQRKS